MKFHDCTPDTLRERLRRYGAQCRWCGRRPGRDFHHIQPREAGGSDQWGNLIWVCEVCHTLLDEFCRKHWNDPAQAARMNELRACSIEAEFQHVEGTVNKKKSQERWNYADIFEMGKEGKVAEPPRTADDIWRDLAELKKYMKVDAFLCMDYLTRFALHQNQAVCGHARGGPVIIAAPSLEALMEKVRELQAQEQAAEQPMSPEESKAKYEEGKQAAREAHQKYKQMEDDFFHKVFRPS
jgi:hypothetical protein